jgi:hypothetical protein
MAPTLFGIWNAQGFALSGVKVIARVQSLISCLSSVSFENHSYLFFLSFHTGQTPLSCLLSHVPLLVRVACAYLSPVLLAEPLPIILVLVIAPVKVLDVNLNMAMLLL